ncbi:hypothetical protein ACFL1D_04895 [Candidatus Omnitrophota bacterium]
MLPVVKNLIEGDKGRIKRIIYAAKRATEREDIFKCISFVSMDYADKYGNDRRSLFAIGQNFFDAYDNIVIGIRQLEISLDTDSAEVNIEATIVARNAQKRETNIFETETAKFLASFQKEEGGWKVIRLEFLDSERVLWPGVS